MNLNNIRIVMVETSHPGNIGAAARAMMTMHIERLVLVNPQCPIGEIAYARASGAHRVLDQRITVADLPAALSDCHCVIATSARSRSLAWPAIDPCEAAARVAGLDHQQEIAFVFGREQSGLTNTELQHCHYQLQIPTAPDYASLNIAAAIQVVCYELLQQSLKATAPPGEGPGEPMATSADMENYFSQLQQTLEATGFIDPEKPRQIMQKLRRIYLRVEPTRNEINLLQGMLAALDPARRR